MRLSRAVTRVRLILGGLAAYLVTVVGTLLLMIPLEAGEYGRCRQAGRRGTTGLRKTRSESPPKGHLCRAALEESP
jgi:hypothetical protein